ncbi:MAG: antibiotic biosynthesis monooxygenase [Rhizobiales bacterium]|nr:antibiotic biosynthesis monooxygenase [Hyphomicrobiales bacterium]
MPFAITVDFELAEGAREEFLKLVKANAAASVRDEPGCSRFDVLTPRGVGGGGDRVFLYEIYDDRTAFEAHLRTPHFADFDSATRPLVRRKTVVEFDVSEGGAP